MIGLAWKAIAGSALLGCALIPTVALAQEASLPATPPPVAPPSYAPYPRPPVSPWAWWQPAARCAEPDNCGAKGRCTLVGNECVAGSVLDCEVSATCRDDGNCTPVNGRCVATMPGQCLWSRGCAIHRQCLFDAEGQRCIDDTKMRNPYLLATGIAITGLGAIAAAAGVLFAFDGSSSHSGEVNVGAAFIIGGVLGAAVGVPLLIVGKQRVPPVLRFGVGSASFECAF